MNLVEMFANSWKQAKSSANTIYRDTSASANPEQDSNAPQFVYAFWGYRQDGQQVNINVFDDGSYKFRLIKVRNGAEDIEQPLDNPTREDIQALLNYTGGNRAGIDAEGNWSGTGISKSMIRAFQATVRRFLEQPEQIADFSRLLE